jgi:hypothetical protein
MKCKNCEHIFLKLDNLQGQCPKCNTKYSTITNESELKLRNLQEEYISRLNDKLDTSNVLDNMYLILKSYSKSIYLKNYITYCYEPDTIDSYCHDASVLLIEAFVIRDGFKISRSFGSLLKRKLHEVIFGNKFNIGYHKEDNKEINDSELNNVTANENSKLEISIVHKLDFDKLSNKLKNTLIDNQLDEKENYIYIIMLRHLINGKKINPNDYIIQFKIGSIDNWNNFYNRVFKSIKESIYE